MKIVKLWSSNLKNGIYGGLFPVIDPFDNDCFYVADGWGSSYPSMKLRKFALSSGKEIQSVYIRNNVRCLNFEVNGTDLFAVTNDKIILLDRNSLGVVAKFEKGIQRYNDYITSNNSDTLLMMNHRMEFLFVFNHKTKVGRKKKIGSCCGIFRESESEYYVFNGRDGKILIYDIVKNSVSELMHTDIFHSVQLCGNNVALLRLGYLEYDAGNAWQIRPTSKFRIIDMTAGRARGDFDTGVDFHSFRLDNESLYLWKQNDIWLYSMDHKSRIIKVSTDRNEYIMGIFPKEGKVLTESDTKSDNKVLYCYDLKM